MGPIIMSTKQNYGMRKLSDIEVDQVSGSIKFQGNPIPILPAPPPVPPGLIG